jgi:predicted dehydrogenase
MLFFENGAIGSVDTFFCIPDNGSKNMLELYGSQGSILAKGTIGQGPSGEMVAFLEREGKAYDAQQARAETEGMVIAPAEINTYQAEIEEFSQAIIDDRKPQISAEAGLRNQKIIDACYKSAKLGEVVEVD